MELVSTSLRFDFTILEHLSTVYCNFRLASYNKSAAYIQNDLALGKNDTCKICYSFMKLVNYYGIFHNHALLQQTLSPSGAFFIVLSNDLRGLFLACLYDGSEPVFSSESMHGDCVTLNMLDPAFKVWILILKV